MYQTVTKYVTVHDHVFISIHCPAQYRQFSRGRSHILMVTCMYMYTDILQTTCSNTQLLLILILLGNIASTQTSSCDSMLQSCTNYFDCNFYGSSIESRANEELVHIHSEVKLKFLYAFVRMHFYYNYA